jgi:hypothetical protein
MDNDRAWRIPNTEYAWSQDYTALIDAMIGGAVLGVVLYDTFRDGTKLFDSCLFMRRPISYKHVDFVASGRGIEYFSARNASEFLELCEKYEVSFLNPKSDRAVRAALEKAVADYGKPGGPWNIPSEPGAWLQMAREALKVECMHSPPSFVMPPNLTPRRRYG